MKCKYLFEIEGIKESDFVAKSAIILYSGRCIEIIPKIYDELMMRYPDIRCIGTEGFAISHIEHKNYKIRYHDYIIILYADEFETISLWSSVNIDNISVADRDKSYIVFSSLSPDKSESAVNSLNLQKLFGMVSSRTIFYQGQLLNNTFLIASFANNSLNGLSINEFDTIKLDAKITKATQNIIKEIEYTPAVEFMVDTIGDFEDESIAEFRVPLILSKKSSENIHKLTSILSIDREKNFIYTYRQVKSGMRLDIGVLTNREELLKRKNILKSIIQDRDLTHLLFVCIGIDKFWKNLSDIRLIEIADILQRDLVAIFGNGEIGKPDIDIESMLLNQTYTLASISEE